MIRAGYRFQLVRVPGRPSAGADPEIGHGGGLNFGRFFRIKTTKLLMQKTPKNGTDFYLTSPKFAIF